MAKKAVRYFTHGHNVEGCLRNGSFVRVHPDGRHAQFMNGDYMGDVTELLRGMVEVPAADAERLIPKCCGGKV